MAASEFNCEAYRGCQALSSEYLTFVTNFFRLAGKYGALKIYVVYNAGCDYGAVSLTIVNTPLETVRDIFDELIESFDRAQLPCVELSNRRLVIYGVSNVTYLDLIIGSASPYYTIEKTYEPIDANIGYVLKNHELIRMERELMELNPDVIKVLKDLAKAISKAND